MYTITKQLNGKYLSECRIQDETVRSEHRTLDEAIEDLKRAAKALNYQTIKKRDIDFRQEVQRTVVVTDYVPLVQSK